jgi:hypothetical protein
MNKKKIYETIIIKSIFASTMYCDYCECLIPDELIEFHYCIMNDGCSEKPTTINVNLDSDVTIEPPNKKNKSEQTDFKINFKTIDLHPVQQKALEWCRKKAKIFHKNVYDNAVIRFLELGFTRVDLEDAIDYIKNIDPIIHFGKGLQSPINWLITETKLKNCFELGYRGTEPCLRIQSEDNLFNNSYTGTDPNLRVKYGCLNLMSDIKGCASAHPYGNSFMILKPEVKPRITFVCGDSFGMQPHICTFDHFVQLFLYLNDEVLKNIIKLAKYAKGKIKQKPIVNNMYDYIEIQIHGDILLSQDIKHIMMYRLHTSPNIMNKLYKDKIPYTIFD